MKPLDQFRRTPLRRYDRAPREETRLTHAGRFRKRHFDLPKFERSSRVLPALFCLWLLVMFVNGSAPLGEVPGVDERFTDWARLHNEQTVKTLPGATPEPGTALSEAVNFNQETVAQQAQVQAAATPTPVPQTKPESEFKLYEPGELVYETDKLSVSIEQKQKDGMTYFVCDVIATDVSQLRTAFAGDDFRSGIYEAVSDIAGRYAPVMAINADFCRYHR